MLLIFPCWLRWFGSALFAHHDRWGLGGRYFGLGILFLRGMGCILSGRQVSWHFGRSRDGRGVWGLVWSAWNGTIVLFFTIPTLVYLRYAIISSSVLPQLLEDSAAS